MLTIIHVLSDNGRSCMECKAGLVWVPCEHCKGRGCNRCDQNGGMLQCPECDA